MNIPQGPVRVAVSIVLRTTLVLGLAASLQQIAFAQENKPAPAISEVKPSVTQPDGILSVSLSTDVTITSVKIGNADAPFVPKSATKEIKVKVPTDVAPGRHALTVTTSDASLNAVITVAPLVLGLKANKDAPAVLSRVVVAGGEVILQFNDKIPTEIRQSLKVNLVGTEEGTTQPETREVHFSVPESDYLILKVPDDLSNKTYAVQASVDKIILDKVPRLRVEYASSMYKRASLMVLGLILLIYLLYKLFYRVPEGQPRYSFLTMLLLEEENQTYSLSRAQFAGWMVVIIWSYLFLYYAHGFVEQDWSYPNLGNAVYAFLISLGTLVASQAASSSVGVKGAGEVHPSPADLVLHGGVLALDRVQQVVWTVIALGMFIRITVSTYATASALPDIPMELLGLMGLSSAGYLGGKLVRGPGPVIEQVLVSGGSVIVNIKGQHLSKDAFVWLDGVQQSKDKVTVKADDPDQPLKFAKELELTLDITLDDWYGTDHAITVVNTDAQRADWHTSAEIIAVTPDQPDDQGKVRLTIKGARVAKGATVQVTGAPGVEAVQDSANPNLFTAVVDAAWVTEPHELILASTGKKSTFSYIPPANG
jgi:hypothetical protein